MFLFRSPSPAPSRHRSRHRSRRSGLAAAGALIGLATAGGAACTPDTDAGPATVTGCGELLQAASEAIEVDAQLDLLDRALLGCGTFRRFGEEIKRHPDLIGFDTETFVRQRCERIDDDRVRSSSTCLAVTPTTTSEPAATTPELVWTGETLDGRPVELRPGPTTPFVDDVPLAVARTADIVSEGGCEGLIAQRDEWAARIDDPDIGDEASVYARHAWNVALLVECDVPDLDGFEIEPPEQ